MKIPEFTDNNIQMGDWIEAWYTTGDGRKHIIGEVTTRATDWFELTSPMGENKFNYYQIIRIVTPEENPEVFL